MLSFSESTVILDMDDKCLVEVFKHLNLLDLCAAADVCTRFKKNAKTCFEYSNKTDLILLEDIKSDCDSEDQIVFETLKILRHFGAHFTKFEDDKLLFNSRPYTYAVLEERAERQHRVLESLIQYCSGTLTELKTYGIEVTDEMLPSMKPLFERLQILEVKNIGTCQAFLDMLPLWSTELRELKLLFRRLEPEEVLQFDGFHQPFKKMTRIVFQNAKGLENNDVEEMLKSNPQLKEITLFECVNVDNQVFESVANYVPDVECLSFSDIPFEAHHALHFGLFSNLKSVAYESRYISLKSTCIVPMIHQIVEANIPLERLCLQKIIFSRRLLDAKQFVEDVSKLKSLHTLKLSFLRRLPTPYFYIICKNLPELRELMLIPRVSTMTLALVSDIIRNAPKLEWFYLGSAAPDTIQVDRVKPVVDSGTFMGWAKIVANRCNKTPLELWLGFHAYETHHRIPIRANEGTFTLVNASCFHGIDVDMDYRRFKKNLYARCGSVNSF